MVCKLDPHRKDSMRPAGEGERGYVMLSVVWLLVLTGSIVAFLMLRSLNNSEQAKSAGEVLRARLALDAAFETIVADRIVEGDRSRWSRAPMEGRIDVEGLAIQVRSTDEARRIDLERADPQLIDSILREAGYSAEQRQSVLGQIALRQGGAAPMRSLIDLEAIFAADARSADIPCLVDRFTFVRGGATTANAAAVMSDSQRGSEAQALVGGAAQRIELSTSRGMSRTIIVRVTGQLGDGFSILDRIDRRLCELPSQ